MAITGTGTQADPYIVSTWDEIAEYVAIKDAYVKCTSNLRFNMNQMFRTGAPALQLHCAEFDGNGLQIVSGYWNNVPAISSAYTDAGNGNNKKIKNLKILSAYTNLYLIEISASAGWTLTLENIVVTGFHTGSNSVFYCSQRSTPCNFVFSGCSFNIKCPNGAFIDSYYSDQHPTLENAYIKFDGVNFSKISSRAPILRNSRVDGKLSKSNDTDISYISSSSINSIINAVVNQMGLNATPSGSPHILLNSSKGNSASSYITGLNETQLKDPTTVAATGFPIYVEG